MKMKTCSNNGNEIHFFEEDHKYLLNGKDQLVSVSTLVDQFFPEFDTETIADRYAKKHGFKKEDVIASWELKKNLACDFGTLVHSWAEAMLLDPDNHKVDSISKNEKEEEYYQSLKKYIYGHFFKRYELIEAEKMVFSPKYGLAGTMDILVREKSTGEIVVLDWKTNEKLEKFNNFNQMGLGPVSHMDDCNFSHYSLQLNMYETLLKEEFLPNEEKFDRRVLHITPQKVLTYKVPPLEDEIAAILKTRVDWKKAS